MVNAAQTVLILGTNKWTVIMSMRKRRASFSHLSLKMAQQSHQYSSTKDQYAPVTLTDLTEELKLVNDTKCLVHSIPSYPGTLGPGTARISDMPVTQNRTYTLQITVERRLSGRHLI